MRRLACVFLLVCAPTMAEDAMFRGNAQHTGVYAGDGISKFTKVRWQFQAKGPVLSSPVVKGETVYVGSSDHMLYALDRASGTKKWEFKTDSRVTSSPAVAREVVYFGSYDGNFYALDAATGKQRWRFATAGERRFAAAHLHGASPDLEVMPDPFDFYLSSPTVANDMVYFGSGDTHIYALDANTGALRWKFKTGDVVHGSPAVVDGVVLVGSWDSYFYALDATTGKEKWRFKTGEDAEIHNQVGIQSSPAVAGGTVYFGCRDSKFYALDLATGKQVWAYANQGSWVITSPALSDGKVYFATSDTGLFHAVDAKTGTDIFSFDNHHWPMFSSPAIAGGLAYIGSHEGKLLAIDLKTHQAAWTFQTDGNKKNGAVYTKEGGLPKYEAAFFDFFYDDMVSGVQKMMSVGAVLSSPVVDGDTLFFGSADGNVYALM